MPDLLTNDSKANMIPDVCQAILSLLFLMIVTATVPAQQLATLSVTVADSSGGSVSGARVTLTNRNTGFARNQTSDSSGFAVLTALSAGDYRLVLHADGFSDYDQLLTLTVGQVASISAQLGLPVARQNVSVSDSSSVATDTEKTESSQEIRSKQIQDLPIVDRDFISFALLTPTANVGRSTATAAQSPFLETVLQLSFAGLREETKNPLSVPGFNTLRVNQFGGNIGGPIRRDRTFYFLGYEGQRRAASPTYSTFILGCLDNPGCMGPGTPSINQVKEQFGLQHEHLNST